MADVGTAINLDLSGGGFVYNQGTREFLFVNADALTGAAGGAQDEIEEMTAGTD